MIKLIVNKGSSVDIERIHGVPYVEVIEASEEITNESANIPVLELGIGMSRSFNYDQLVAKNISSLSTNTAKSRNDSDYQMAKKYKELYKMFKKKYKMKYQGQVRQQAIELTRSQINKMRGNTHSARIGVM